ncbi:MAG: phosphatase PAP2 family protein [Clostridia bacterium]|nr:phosphatase PAP2 family protein [Clostridia bacterium]
MEFLKFLQELRNPVLDGIFSVLTFLGDETVFILIGILFFWCINKKQGYYILSVGLLGTVVNQFMKLMFRIPRPWVIDPEFTIVESAREAATGFSFPSGHSQSSVGIFGSIALFNKKKWLRGICIALCVLVPFSRMWLGVHTPLDVIVGALSALVIIFLLYPVFKNGSRKAMRIMFGLMVAFSVCFILYVHLFDFPSDVDAENLAHGAKNAYKMLGCIMGMWLSYEVDAGYTDFETKAPLWIQAIKLVGGLIPVVLIKSLLKSPLNSLIGVEYVADGIRYFLLCAFAGCIWPMTFKHFLKLKKNENNN